MVRGVGGECLLSAITQDIVVEELRLTSCDLGSRPAHEEREDGIPYRSLWFRSRGAQRSGTMQCDAVELVVDVNTWRLLHLFVLARDIEDKHNHLYHASDSTGKMSSQAVRAR